MHVNLDDWYKPDVDRKKLKNLSKKKDLPGLLHFLIYFIFLFVSSYLAYLTLGLGGRTYSFLYTEQFMHSV